MVHNTPVNKQTITDFLTGFRLLVKQLEFFFSFPRPKWVWVLHSGRQTLFLWLLGWILREADLLCIFIPILKCSKLQLHAPNVPSLPDPKHWDNFTIAENSYLFNLGVIDAGGCISRLVPKSDWSLTSY